METGAQARGSAGWARGRALGDGVSGRRVAQPRCRRLHANHGAQRERGRAMRNSNRLHRN